MTEPIRGAGQPSFWPPAPYQVAVASAPGSAPPPAGIARGGGADWFGPLDPLKPIAPPEVAGRRFDFPTGYNLSVRPRAYEPIGFAELRGFADAYDLLRLVIETRKDQMERQRWCIRPRGPLPTLPRLRGREGRGDAVDADITARIAALEKFWQKPDGVTRWKTWLRALLEDMFVIDAATLYCRRTRPEQLRALHPLDAATIKRVIDDWGRPPQPYAAPDGTTIYPPAYQQVLKGLPAIDYSVRDVIYRPRNVRPHRVYGSSPVQQVLMTVNIALRRQLWQLDYFSEGSVPDALIGVPAGWTPDQIRQFQDYWDTEFAGDLAKRRRAKFVPGESAVKVHQTKEPEHKQDFDEWLPRITCVAFSVPPQWAVKLMNRPTADNQSAQAEEEGLEPTKEWVKDLVDEVIADEFASPHLELAWLEEDTGAAQAEAALEARVKIGAATLNELRDALGLAPFQNPAADRPMVLTATGYVPIEVNAGGVGGANPSAGKQATKEHSIAGASSTYQKAAADDPEHPGWPAGAPDGKGGQFRPKDSNGAESPTDSKGPSEGPAKPGVQYAALETGTQTDASHVPNGRGSSGGAEADGGAESRGQPERGPQYAQLQIGTPTDAAEGAPHVAVSAVAPNGTTVIYTYDDGSQDVYSGGSVSWRNNNPGNMIAGAGGINPIGRNGRFAIFPDYQSGFDAIVANLERPGYQAVTIGEAIRLWAPEAAGNDPVAYANHIQTWTGLPPDMPMDVLTTAQINAVALAIQRQEGYVRGTITHIPPPPNR